jgi:hypothetical protein
MLPLNPFLFLSIRKYMKGTVFELHAIRFAIHEKADYFAIDHADVFKI